MLSHAWIGVAVGAAMLAGCSGGAGEDTGTVVTTPSGTTPVLTDTGWPPGDVGNFHVVQNVNDGTLRVFAVAASSPPNYPNLAECGGAGSVCIGGFPSDDDTFVVFDPDQTLDLETVDTRYLGYEITVGPYTLPYKEDPETGYGAYAVDGTATPIEPGWYPVGWGGQWPKYGGGQDLYVSAPIELLSPHIEGSFTLTNGSTLPIEWVPTGEGFVTLAVVPKFGDGALYRLHDDGYFELPADDLGVTSEIEDLSVILSRWNITEDQRFGHVLNFVASSDVVFGGQLLNIGSRTEIDPADKCSQAEGSLPLGPGEYWGTNAGNHNDLDPFTCLSGPNIYADARGNDGIIRLEVGPHHSVAVDYNLADVSASVYFLTDCNDADTCTLGSDLDAGPNVHEYLSYFNPDNDPRTIFLIADSSDNDGELVYTLNLTDELLEAPPMVDTCADAEAAWPIGSTTYPTPPADSYYADFVAFTGSLNPGTGGCTGTSLPGPEGMMAVDIPAGMTLSANVNMPGGDPALYMLYNCNDAFSCAGGADISLGATEAVVHQNTGAYPQRVYLVVDSKVGLKPYFIAFSFY